MKKLRFFLIPFILIIFIIDKAPAQIGGNSTYKFLNLTNSARIAAMGGNFLAIKDGDLNLALYNPSLITKEMDNNLALSFVDYFADMNYGFAAYSKSFNKIGTYTAALQYINYGKFTYADETGQTYGTFGANEMALNIGWGRELDSLFSIGANMKFIYSSLEDYVSYGLAVDVSGTYYNPKHLFTVSLIARNIGTQLKAYRSGNTEPLPFELEVGLSQKLKHLPFRYSILFTNLQKWDLTYNKNDSNADDVEEKSGINNFGDKAMRHIVIGGEFIPSKYFSIRFGYNYQRRQELGVDSKMAMVGFSWGIGLNISKFRIDYSRATYHLYGSPNYISISTNLSAFAKKK